jgi:hypothetical protein
MKQRKPTNTAQRRYGTWVEKEPSDGVVQEEAEPFEISE